MIMPVYDSGLILPAASSPRAGLNHGHTAGSGKSVFRMVQGDRMAGSVPVWGPATSMHETTTATLHQAKTAAPAANGVGGLDGERAESALAYQPAHHVTPMAQPDEPFGFGDLIDIINPLHHIPLVGSLYRELTGDTIRDSGRILGGAIFGGGLGVIAGFANTIVAHETGANIEDHAFAALRGDTVGNSTNAQSGTQLDTPHGSSPGTSMANHTPKTNGEMAATLAQLDAAITGQGTSQPTADALLAFNATQSYTKTAAQTARAAPTQVWKFNT